MRFKAQETTYYARDLDAAVTFYTQAYGAKLLKRFDWGFALLDIDGAGGRIGIFDAKVHDREAGQQPEHPRPRLTLQARDLEAEVARLRSAGATVTEPQGKKGSHRSCHALDPEGNPIFIWEDGTGSLQD